MTLSDLQGHSPGHSPIASLFKWDFSYSCATADKISTDIARRGIPVSQLSLLLLLFPVGLDLDGLVKFM